MNKSVLQVIRKYAEQFATRYRTRLLSHHQEQEAA